MEFTDLSDVLSPNEVKEVSDLVLKYVPLVLCLSGLVTFTDVVDLCLISDKLVLLTLRELGIWLCVELQQIHHKGMYAL